MFYPGARGTVTVTVHNAGPDDVGPAQFVNVVSEYINAESRPFPYQVFLDSAVGCLAGFNNTEAFPDGSIYFYYSYYFQAIPAGQSATCVYDVQLSLSAYADVPLEWTVSAFNDFPDVDPNPSNNAFDAEFVGGAIPPPASVPCGGRMSYLAMLLGLLGLGLIAMRRAKIVI